MRMSRVHPGDSALLRQHGKNHILFKDKNPPLVKIPWAGQNAGCSFSFIRDPYCRRASSR
jgi:hypothetical protein